MLPTTFICPTCDKAYGLASFWDHQDICLINNPPPKELKMDNEPMTIPAPETVRIDMSFHSVIANQYGQPRYGVTLNGELVHLEQIGGGQFMVKKVAFVAAKADTQPRVATVTFEEE